MNIGFVEQKFDVKEALHLPHYDVENTVSPLEVQVPSRMKGLIILRTAIRGSHVSPVLVFSFRGGHFHGRRRDPARGLTPPDRTFRTRQPGKL